MSINVMSQYNNHFPTKPEVNNNKRRHSSYMHINMNKGSGIIEFTTREGKLKIRRDLQAMY